MVLLATGFCSIVLCNRSVASGLTGHGFFVASCFITGQLLVVLLATGFCSIVLCNRSVASGLTGHGFLLHRAL